MSYADDWSMSYEEATAYQVILKERFPREEGESDQDWFDRRNGIARENRVMVRDMARSSQSGDHVPTVEADIA